MFRTFSTRPSLFIRPSLGQFQAFVDFDAAQLGAELVHERRHERLFVLLPAALVRHDEGHARVHVEHRDVREFRTLAEEDLVLVDQLLVALLQGAHHLIRDAGLLRESLSKKGEVYFAALGAQSGGLRT